jgi:hypothetical protein
MKRLLMAFLVLGLSCGGHDGDEPTDMSPQGVCAFYADKDCAGYEGCDPYDLGEYFNDCATCRERLARSCVSRLTATGTNETPTRVVDCAKAIDQLSCEGYLDTARWPESCSLLPGKLPDGAGCIVAGQCEGKSCVIANRDACGVCRTVSPAGGTCVLPNDCVDFIPCVEGVCTLPGSVGTPCNEVERQCAYGLTCRGVDSTGMGTCQHYVPTGAPCDSHSPFGECDFMHGDTCDLIANVCNHNLDWFARAGEACDNGLCNTASFCNPQSLCQVRPREGQPCAPNENGQGVCLSPARCLNGVCAIRDPAVCR